MITNSCAFSGHRAQKLPWEDENCAQAVHFKRLLCDQIQAKNEAGCDVFLTGMCNGVDIIAGELILQAKQVDENIRLIAVIPYEGFESAWCEHWQKRYFDLANQADSKILISSNYTKDCFKKRNRYLVDHAQHLIAVKNADDRFSGTFQTINFAKRKKRDIVMIEPKSLQVMGMGE